LAGERSQNEVGVADVAAVRAGVAADIVAAVGQNPLQSHPRTTLGVTENRQIIDTCTSLRSSHTQNSFSKVILKSEIIEGANEGDKKNYFIKVRRKNRLGVTARDGLTPATLDDLEECFPRDRW
jgi:hypothetical protein